MFAITKGFETETGFCELGSPVLLDLITPLLTGMIFLLTAVSFCGLEKIFVELQTCLHVPVPNVTVS